MMQTVSKQHTCRVGILQHLRCALVWFCLEKLSAGHPGRLLTHGTRGCCYCGSCAVGLIAAACLVAQRLGLDSQKHWKSSAVHDLCKSARALKTRRSTHACASVLEHAVWKRSWQLSHSEYFEWLESQCSCRARPHQWIITVSTEQVVTHRRYKRALD